MFEAEIDLQYAFEEASMNKLIDWNWMENALPPRWDELWMRLSV